MLRWIREHFKLTVVVTVILGLLVMISTSFFFDYSRFLPYSIIQKAVSFVQAPFTKAGNGVADSAKGIIGLRDILAQNEKMKQEITELNKEIINSKLAQNELAELRELSAALNYLHDMPQYGYVTGDVVAQDGTNWFSTFTINVGEKQGIQKDDIIINGDGLVGRVISTGSTWSKILTVIDDSGSVSFRISRNIQYTGILTGDGEGGLEGYLVDTEADVIEGDVLITSGLGIYPQGITIGKVTKIESDDDKLLRTIKITPSVKFNSVQKVTAIKTHL